MTITDSARDPLTPTRIVATFGIGVVGFMSANLVPFMILAVQDSFGIGATEAGTLMTACLLSTALACLAVTRFTERRGRFLVARLGLATTAIGFGVAAAGITPVLSGIGIIVGGLGAGGAVAAGGAALAALRNPNRVSGINGLSNRALVTVVLAIIPVIGISMFSAFGLLAGLAALAFLTAGWLPLADAPAQAAARSATTVGAATTPGPDQVLTGAIVTTGTGSQRVRTPTRRIAFAGLALLTMFAVWAVGEDSIWAMSGAIGITQAGMSEAQLGLVLSASTAGGLVASIGLVFVGARLGRALPLGILLVLGATLKLASCLATDPTVYLVAMIAWNMTYAIAFMYIVAAAAALDASGRWSGPVLGVYLIGSSFAPLVGAGIGEAFGFPALGVTLAAISLALLVPLVLVARLSTRVEQEQQEDGDASPDIDLIRTAGV